VKIAVSGAHWTGKTTLVEELCQILPNYLGLDEPYYLLQEEGHVFPEMPSLEDFELQLSYSIKQIANSDENIIFDRCPADMLAYLIAHADYENFDLETWLPKIQNAMTQLDLLVFVPIEQPDLIMCPEGENTELRSRVDDELCDIILGDVWDFNLEVVEVSGSASERVNQVLRYGRFDVMVTKREQ
jgi:hypothetical protein